MKFSLQSEFGGKSLSMEAGRMARQAAGSVVVSYGDTMVLVTACREPEPKVGQDFLPLTVEYKERYYASGRIPGGFFKREGRPTDRETLTSRLIDRPIRPLFPEGYALETQIIAFVISSDGQHDADILAINGASAALTISDIPFQGPIGAVRIGRINGQLVVNPLRDDLANSDMNIVIAGSRDAIVMVEGGGEEFSEETFIDAAELAQREIQRSIDLQLELANLVGTQKLPKPTPPVDHALVQAIQTRFGGPVLDACLFPGKHERAHKLHEVRDQVLAGMVTADAPDKDELTRKIKAAFKEVESRVMRDYVLREGKRADGRSTTQIRPITVEVGVLPRAHGAALFTRGETQALVTATLGSSRDEQMLDNIDGESSERFLLHYNFPPFSVGEVKFMRGPGRREIGHGALAERAIRPMLPPKEKFPYTVRVVSDITESNGSSSMASVCGSSLALMDAGVPIRSAVAGIAMGLISEGDRVAVLSDILGVEDHLGDMDFKVAGTERGITAIQMDIKIGGISRDLLGRALEQAREGRLFILGEMARVISEPRVELSRYAPRILSIKISPDRIKDVIGPGGKVIKGIIAETGVDIDIEDTGIVNIVSNDATAANRAREIIESLTEELEIGKVYLGEVKRIESYGAFVQITPGNEGLLHVTQLADHYIKNVSDELQEGQKLLVKLIDIDKQGRLKLSRKAAMAEEGGNGQGAATGTGTATAEREPRPERAERPERPERPDRPDRGDRPERGDRGDRSDRPERGRDRFDRPERSDSDRGRDRPRGRSERNGERPERDRDRVRDESADRDRDRDEPPRDRAPRERPRDDGFDRDRTRDDPPRGRDRARDDIGRDRARDDSPRDRGRDDFGRDRERDEPVREPAGRERRDEPVREPAGRERRDEPVREPAGRERPWSDDDWDRDRDEVRRDDSIRDESPREPGVRDEFSRDRAPRDRDRPRSDSRDRGGSDDRRRRRRPRRSGSSSDR